MSGKIMVTVNHRHSEKDLTGGPCGLDETFFCIQWIWCTPRVYQLKAMSVNDIGRQLINVFHRKMKFRYVLEGNLQLYQCNIDMYWKQT